MTASQEIKPAPRPASPKRATPRLVIGWIWIALDVGVLVKSAGTWAYAGCPQALAASPTSVVLLVGKAMGVFVACGLVPVWCGFTAWKRHGRGSGWYLGVMGLALMLVYWALMLFSACAPA